MFLYDDQIIFIIGFMSFLRQVNELWRLYALDLNQKTTVIKGGVADGKIQE